MKKEANDQTARHFNRKEHTREKKSESKGTEGNKMQEYEQTPQEAQSEWISGYKWENKNSKKVYMQLTQYRSLSLVKNLVSF